ncbi:MAG TPA: nucleoside transporter C-terminal domain-containing protein [Gammaproteobacteria bacterium]|nr:nucleoside transporter C-terminal domain-containing protein [Gammaproteobacteria bacterium]
MPGTLQSLLGLIGFVLVAWLLSERRDIGAFRIGAVGVSIQVALAFLLLELPPLKATFAGINHGVLALQQSTQAGSGFVFGYLASDPLPFEETRPGASFILAFRALPLIIVVSALTSLLIYWRILPLMVRGFSYLLQKTLGVGGAVGLSAAANVFVGMVEAPLFIRPYLAGLSRSELFVLMCTGMATIAGTVLVLYAAILGPVVPDAAGHLLVASLISAPAAITVARIMVPQEGPPAAAALSIQDDVSSAMDAVTQGTQTGVRLYINVVAMLLVLVALVHLVNLILGTLPDVGGDPITLERILGVLMAPVVWLMGVPWDQALTAGALMGIKTVLNEFLAYSEMVNLPADALDPRSRLIMTYALCGFANFGSLGIMIGGLATMVPDRREEIVSLGFKSIVGGTLATSLTGAVVGLL